MQLRVNYCIVYSFGGCNMMKFKISFWAFVLCHWAFSAAAGSLFCDGYNCSGEVNGETVDIFTTSTGDILGTVGNKSVNIFDDGSGNIFGSIGDDTVNTMNTGGGAVGFIGDNMINLISGESGSTGTIGEDSFDIYEDDL